MSVHYSPSSGVIVRLAFWGDPANLPDPRKVGGQHEPLKSSRYHKPGYAERREAARRVSHFSKKGRRR